jgi:hypothetical protein
LSQNAGSIANVPFPLGAASQPLDPSPTFDFCEVCPVPVWPLDRASDREATTRITRLEPACLLVVFPRICPLFFARPSRPSRSSYARAGTQQQQGQAVLDVKSATHLCAEYLADLDTLHAKITELAKAIPADKYGWRPSADVRTVAQVLMHVASEYHY